MQQSTRITAAVNLVISPPILSVLGAADYTNRLYRLSTSFIDTGTLYEGISMIFKATAGSDYGKSVTISNTVVSELRGIRKTCEIHS